MNIVLTPSSLVRRKQQNGAALIVSLVVLVALTVLGLSAMNTTQLETNLAFSSQESVKAFQAAETALSIAIEDGAMWNTAGAEKTDEAIAGGYDIANYKSQSAGIHALPDNGPLWSAKFGGAQGAYFDFEATGITESNNSATVHGGAYQIVWQQ